MIQKQIKQFLHYLEVERGLSPRTIRAYEYDLNKFANFLLDKNNPSLSNIIKNDIREFLSELAKNGFQKPNSGITRARKLSAIKSFFKYLTREGIVDVNPAIDIETPKIPEREPCYLTEQEYELLLQTVREKSTVYYNARDLAIVTMFLGTGMRLSELVGLNLGSIDTKDGLVKVLGKGNKERTIPLNDKVVAALEKYLKGRPEIESKAFFVSRLGNRLSSGGVYHLIKHFLKESKIKKEKIGVHSLRHSFGASLLNKNVNLVVIQELLGHKRLETTRRYLHINNLDLRNAVEQIVFK